MKYFLLIALTVAQSVVAENRQPSALASSTAQASSPRPNILYFYVDDMGWGSIGPNGQAERKARGLPYVQTPNINRLAAEGVNFRRGYACTVCSPSRASQQTGYHQGHTFADRNDPDNARKAMRTDDVTMGDVLSSAGYQTGYWGKWGFGGSKDHDAPTIDNVQTLPTSHGYKHVLAELHHVRAHTFFQPTLWHAPAKADAVGGLELIPNSMAPYRQRPKYPNTPALQNHDDYPKIAYCDDSYALAALDFVRQQGQNCNSTGQPFFGLLAVQIPHGPFEDVSTLPDWDNAYADDPKFASLAEQSQQWAAMVTRIDAHFGNILAALEDPNHDGDKSDSVAENTLVIFQSDNGGPSGKNNQQLDANGGLQGVKGTVYEGGIRVPLVMRWPAKINSQSKLKAGSQTDMVVDITDLLPTFCELAGESTPAGVDGVSIAATLLGTGHQRTRDFIIHETTRSHSIIQGRYKLIRDNKSVQLFDLETDHSESTNIAKQHPELVKKLTQLLDGERVNEPKGFANTYHHWMGADGAKTSNADNWSDYEYSNAGQTYITDKGPPRLSWTARVANTGDSPNNASVDTDVEVLSLEILGNTAEGGTQRVQLALGVKLTGRNEIRIGANGVLVVNGGAVSSLRWVDVRADGELRGSGVIAATVYNDGVVCCDETDGRRLNFEGDFFQAAHGCLKIRVGSSTDEQIIVAGKCQLGGLLEVICPNEFKPTAGASFPLLQAGTVAGRFSNADSEVVASNGVRFGIEYTNDKVTLVAK